MKYLLLVIGLVLAYCFLKAYARRAKQGGGSRHVEDMVRCAECGLHLPRSESVTAGDAYYCTAEHRRLHQKTD